ncbi:MAG: glycosyltransferase family 39 protein, partial [Pseudomonadota bacterium]
MTTTRKDAHAGGAGKGRGKTSAKSSTGGRKGGGAKRAGKTAPRRGAARGIARPSEPGAARYALAALALVLVLSALRLGVNALDLIPVHFDEAQYWAYGQELAWGYFSKPPLVGAVIRVTTDFGGDTLFALRLGSVLAHALIALGLFLLGRRLFDAATGFWAAAAYSLAPGVTVSALIMSTDPVMMVFWIIALLAWVRAAEGGRDADWALMGAAIGLGALAKYTMLVMPVGALAYGLFSARGRDWRGTGIATATALLVLGPNLLWNWQNSF